MLALAPTMPDEGSTPPTGPDGIGDLLLRRELKARLFGVEAPPIRVGRYLILERIGQGGMGVVYRARDESLARDVAVKLLSPGLATGRERFGREARALAQLAHPNVVTIHEVGTHDERLFLAMEYVEGPTMRAWLKTEPTPRQILGVLRQAAQGLLAAHDVGLVHRDFKPDNVIVGADGRVRILDFGLAKALTDGTRQAVHTQQPDATEAFVTVGGVGTPGYIAPEQLTGLSVDPRTDQYSFCVAAWEALFGAMPEMEHGRVIVPRGIEVPTELEDALVRGLSPDPDDRHGDLRPLLDALTPSPTRRVRPTRRWRAGLTAAGIGGIGLYAMCLAQPLESDPPDEDATTAAPTDGCPEGFAVDPEHGCTSPEIECAPFVSDEIPDCSGDKVRCCVRESIAVEFEMLEARNHDNPVVAKTMWGRLLTLIDLACRGGEAASCMQAGLLAQEPQYGEPNLDRAREYAERGCELGNARACTMLGALD
jgi:predicted Ser/Thr protein kinase